MPKTDQFNSIYQKLLNLTQSPLYQYRIQNHYQPVLGEGSLSANLMLIGEAPGEKEAQSGKPFVGAAGRLLDSFLQNASIPRSEVFITSLLHDRPPQNRNPHQTEIELYFPFTLELISLITPSIIACLGRFSTQTLFTHFGLNPGPLNQIRGQFFPVHTAFNQINLVALYHPAAALYNPSLKPKLETDYQQLSHFLHFS